MIMQAVMWLILGATVAVAALITSHRQKRSEVKLNRTITSGQLTVQLPGSWRISSSIDPLSPTLITATEQAGDEEDGRRTIRIIREPLPQRFSPTEYLELQFPSDETHIELDGALQSIRMADSAGVLQSAVVQHEPQSARDVPRDLARGVEPSKLIIAAAVPASNKGIAVVLDGEGIPETFDVDLVKRIAQTIKLADEPKQTDEKQLTIGEGIGLNIPDGFTAVENKDPLRTARELRPAHADADADADRWRAIDLVPVVLSDKDGAEAISTMLGEFDDSFSASDPHREANGVWAIAGSHPDQNPSRAYAVAKDGQGIMVILRGGNDEQWMDAAWQAIAGSIQWPAHNSTNQMISAGAELAGRVTDAGSDKLRSQDQNDQWWLAYVRGPEKPIRWVHLEPSTNGGRFESRSRLPDRWLQDYIYNWRSSVDLKTSYRATDECTFTPLLGGKVQNVDKVARMVSADLSKGKLELSTRGGDAGNRDLTYSVPGNYVPGGWLPDILATVSDTPMILRVDSFFDDSSAQNTDLLTVIVRPTPLATRQTSTTHRATPLRSVSIEVSGNGQRSIWYLRADGSLDSIDYADSIHLARQDLEDITKTFSREPQMKPQ
jgi:hypothetical protein